MTPPLRLRRSSEIPCIIRGATVVDSTLRPPRTSDVFIAQGRIQAVAPRLDAPAGVEIVDGSGAWLLPGWIDLQVNDAEWLSAGPKSLEAHAARVAAVAQAQAERGVTGLILATLAAPLEEVITYLQGMRLALDRGEPAGAKTFFGALVEGTFMNPAHSGAQNPAFVLRPDRATLDRLLDTGAVRCINIAPEMSEDAIELVRHATARGVVVGAGHSNAHAVRLRAAAEAGLRYSIHLGNGPTGTSWKAFDDGGFLEEALRNDAIVATIILDGWHVHPQLARDWIERKEPSRVALVSDAGFALSLPQGEFQVFGIRGAVAEGGRYLRVVPRQGAAAPNPHAAGAAPLFGSAVGMCEVFENAVNLLRRAMPGVHCRLHTERTLPEAVRAAAVMCSSTPARLLGLADRGRIEAGLRSDLLLAEIAPDPQGAVRVSLRCVWAG